MEILPIVGFTNQLEEVQENIHSLADNCNGNRYYISCKPPNISVASMENASDMAQEKKSTKGHICNANGTCSTWHKTRYKYQNLKSPRGKRHPIPVHMKNILRESIAILYSTFSEGHIHYCAPLRNG